MAECELHGGGRERRRGADFLMGPLRALGAALCVGGAEVPAVWLNGAVIGAVELLGSGYLCGICVAAPGIAAG